MIFFQYLQGLYTGNNGTGIPGVDGTGRESVVESLPTDTYPSRATMCFTLIASHPDCVRQPPVPVPMIITSFPPTPVPVPVVKTRLPTQVPTQVPTAGEAYILPFPFRQFPDVYPFTCLSVNHPGSHNSSPPCTDVSNYLVPTIDSHKDEGMRPTNHVFSHPHERARHPYNKRARHTRTQHTHVGPVQ